MTNAERFKEIFTTQITRRGAVELLAWLESTDFFTAPASTKYHGAYSGGLAEHSLNVYYALIESPLARQYTAESRAICALLHDVCKADYYAVEYRNHKNAAGQWEKAPVYIVKDNFPFGHGEKSAFLIGRYMALSDIEALAIRWHMGAYDEAARGGSRTLSAAMRESPLVLALHTADMVATQKEMPGEEE